MVVQERVRIWKELKAMLAKVTDKDLYNGLLAEYRRRAIAEWGYDPERGEPVQATSLSLTDWEKDLVRDIRKSQLYELDVREEKRKKTDAEARVAMMDYVRSGGLLEDIPENIRCDGVDALYRECRDKIHADLMREADFAIGA